MNRTDRLRRRFRQRPVVKECRARRILDALDPDRPLTFAERMENLRLKFAAKMSLDLARATFDDPPQHVNCRCHIVPVRISEVIS